jgi:hypothetical protein
MSSISTDGLNSYNHGGNTADSAGLYNYLHEKIAEAIFIREKALGIR